jgi:HK97 family phage major capsid protein
VSIGAVLRGIVHGDWRGVGKPLERAVGETGDSVFPVPESISSEWIDMARAASVAFRAGAITLPMRTLTERIVAVTQDPVFTFRKEHRVIPESDIVLGPIDLKARFCAAIVRTSIELLEDSPYANELIQRVLINKAAQMIDWALLSGDGSQAGDLDNPTGLLNWPGVPAIDAVVPPVNYDPVIDAYASVLTANGVPTAMITSAAMAATYAKIRSGVAGDMTTLETPALIAELPKYFTGMMPPNTSVVGDFSMLAWGLRTDTKIEATRVGGDGTFSKGQVEIRLYFRGDTAVLRPTWFAKVAPGTLLAEREQERQAPVAPARTNGDRATAAAR